MRLSKTAQPEDARSHSKEGDAGKPGVGTSVFETALTNGLLAVVGLVTGIIAARWLGPVGRGELAAIQLWPSALAGLGTIGLPDALAYFSAKHRVRSRGYLSTATLTALVLVPVAAVVWYPLMPLLLPTQSDHVVRGAQRYLLVFLPLHVLVAMPHQVLRGIQEFRLWNALRAFPPLLWLGVLAVALALGRDDPVWLTTAYLILFAAFGPAMAWMCWTRTTGSAAPTTVALGSLLRYGFPSALSALPQFFNLRLDQIAVTALLPARQLGIYVTALAWSGCIPLFSNALAVIVSTRIAADASARDQKRHFYRGAQGAAWLIAVPVVLLLIVTPIGMTSVFGSDFEQGVLPAMVLVVASGANAFNVVLEELLRGYGRPGATVWAESTAVAVGLFLLLSLVPSTGLLGASAASMIGYLAATSVLLSYCRRLADLNVVSALDPRGIRWSEVPLNAYRALRIRLG